VGVSHSVGEGGDVSVTVAKGVEGGEVEVESKVGKIVGTIISSLLALSIGAWQPKSGIMNNKKVR
jgi:hypothetical protein